jgi:hypothetical protein
VADERRRLRGVAILGRPVARRLDDGHTVEVTRVATDGCPNACSTLYGAARRIARALGYGTAITYTRADEPGTSLRAAGWHLVAHTRAGSWNRRHRSRRTRAADRVEKMRWEIRFADPAAARRGTLAAAVSPRSGAHPGSLTRPRHG